MKREWSISQMCDKLEKDYYADMTPEHASHPMPSPQRVKALAMEKLHKQQEKGLGKPMKKTAYKTVLAAALIAVLTLSAVAAFGGLEYFRSLFGDSANLVQDEIQMPEGAVAQNEQYRLQVESLLTDGYTTNIVVSLTNLSGGSAAVNTDQLFQVQSEVPLQMAGWQEMWGFSTESKQYFNVEASTAQRFDCADLTIVLREDIAPLQVTVTAQNKLGVLQLEFPEEDFSASNYRIESLQVSPMGFLSVGVENEVKGGLPSLSVSLLMQDGTVDVLTDMQSFDGSPDDGETVSGGGSAIILDDWSQAPLVITTQGTRNPENQMITTGQFSRILDLNTVQAVIVEGKTYPVK